MAHLMGLLGRDETGEDEEDVQEEDKETDEEEGKEEEEEKSGDESQEILNPSCDENPQSKEEGSCAEVVGAKAVEESDILKELWR